MPNYRASAHNSLSYVKKTNSCIVIALLLFSSVISANEDRVLTPYDEGFPRITIIEPKKEIEPIKFQGQGSKPVKCLYSQTRDSAVDSLRTSTRNGLCRVAKWADGIFGDEHEFNDEEFRGKISIGFRQDEDDGFDPRLRVKIRTKLPNVSSRFNAFIGRVEEDSYVSNTEVKNDQVSTVGLRSDDEDDAEWLVGIGYSNPNKRKRGFDFSAGAKLSGGLNPYVKGSYHHLYSPTDNHYWKTKQTLFWRNDEGYGFSSTLDYTYLLNDRNILEWDVDAKYTEKVDQWEWITSTTWHHSFTRRVGISSSAYVRGEEKNPVSIPEFGVTFTHVRPILRPWLTIETGIDFRWEKEEGEDEYSSATRVGIQLEMLLGDYYGRR